MAQSKVRIGRQEPTKWAKSKGRKYHGDFEKIYNPFLESIGIFLFPWQAKILRIWLAKDLDNANNWFYNQIGLSVPRRNGKSEVIIAYIFIKMLLHGERILYTSYLRESFGAVFDRMIEIISQENHYGRKLRKHFGPLKRVGNKYMGRCIKVGSVESSITSKNGGYLAFSTRAGGGRGQGFDDLIFDEAQTLVDGDLDAYLPTADQPNSQVIYAGSPIPLDSEKTKFLKIRKSLLEQDFAAAYSFWAEWGVEKVVNKQDTRNWYRTNPSMGLASAERGGIEEKTLLNKMHMKDESFAVEHLGYWKHGSNKAIIDTGIWAETFSEQPEYSPTDRISLGIKFSVDGKKFSIGLASRGKGRKDFVQLFAHGSINEQVQYFSERSEEPLVYKNFEEFFINVLMKLMTSRNCVSVLVDGFAGSQHFKQLLAKYRLWNMNGHKYSQGKISFLLVSEVVKVAPFFVDILDNRQLTHLEDTLLDTTVANIEMRKVRGQSSGYAFGGVSTSTEVEILDCVAMALYSISNNYIPKAVPVRRKSSLFKGAIRTNTRIPYKR